MEGKKWSGYARLAAAIYDVAATLASILSIIFLGISTVLYVLSHR